MIGAIMKYLLAIIGLVFLVSACGNDTPKTSDSPWNKVHISKVDLNCIYNCGVLELRGELKNTSTETLKFIYIKYEMIDKQGRIIGFVNDIYQNLRPNEVWVFKGGHPLRGSDPMVDSYRLAELRVR
jgi:hypothetical protein